MHLVTNVFLIYAIYPAMDGLTRMWLPKSRRALSAGRQSALYMYWWPSFRSKPEPTGNIIPILSSIMKLRWLFSILHLSFSHFSALAAAIISDSDWRLMNLFFFSLWFVPSCGVSMLKREHTLYAAYCSPILFKHIKIQSYFAIRN